MTPYSYERNFRMKIIACLLDNIWMAKYGSAIIQPAYFESEDEIRIVQSIFNYREAYQLSPSDPDDLIVLAGADYASTVYAIFDIKEGGEYRLAADEAIKFAKQQAAKIAIVEGIDDIGKGDFATAIERMKEALKVGDNLLSTGIDPVADADKWLFDMYMDKVPTGQFHLDQVLNGGLGVPELGVILAPPNAGKSMELINIGYGAASIPSGKNVVHFTHEMKAADVATRYAARMVFRFPNAEGEDMVAYQDQLVEKARRVMKGKIRIIGGAHKMTTSEFESHMDRLVDEGFKPGLIIDDYLDLMVPPRHYNERRFELSSTYEWARAMSEKYQCPFWTASQGNRASLTKEIITMQDIAEDIGKGAVCDVMVALCQTYDEAQKEQCRLFLAKVRNASKKVPLIACKFFSNSQAIITTGFTERKGQEEKDA